MSSDNPTSELSCQLCKTSHSSEWELKEHLWSLLHHVKLEQKAKNSVHQCILCQTTADNLVGYGQHLNEQKHKQALEKAKEKKKPKPKLSHSRKGLGKTNRTRSKRTLIPNPNWHLDPVSQHSLRGNRFQHALRGNRLFQHQFGKWRPVDDWQWKVPNNSVNNNFECQNDYYRNNNNFYNFSSSHWQKTRGYVPNNGFAEANHPNSSYKYQNFDTMRPKYMFPSSSQNLKNDLPVNKAPPLATKNSISSNSNSSSESQPLASPADYAKSNGEASDLSKNSQMKKGATILKANVNPSHSPQIKKQKLKIKGGIVKTPSPKKKKKKKKKGKESSGINNKSAVTVIQKDVEKRSADVSGTNAAASTKESDDVPANKKHPSTSKTASPVLSKDSNPIKESLNIAETKNVCQNTSPTERKSSVNSKTGVQVLPKKGKSIKESQNVADFAKTKNVSQNVGLAERKSSENPKDSSLKSSTNVNSKEDPAAPLKRNFNSTDSLSSSLNVSKKQKILPKSDSLGVKTQTAESNSSNLQDKANSDPKAKNSVENNSSKQNKNSDKEKAAGIVLELKPTQEERRLLPSLPLRGEEENSFKINKEVVSNLHKKLIGQNLIKPPKSKSSEDAANSKEDSNSSGKSNSAFVRQEELVKMMKPSRLNRKEKMHLSSLLQSYTKSQNKKLAVPRLTMQLSGLYDNSNNNDQDLTSMSEISELELPSGMEEQIAYLIKKENIETVPFEDSEKQLYLASLNKQSVKTKNTPASVNQKRQKERQPKNFQPAQSSPPQNSSDIGRLSINPDLISPPVEPHSSQTNDVSNKNGAPLNNSSSLSSTCPSLPETSSQANSCVPTTTGTQVNSCILTTTGTQVNSCIPTTTSTQANSCILTTTGTQANSSANLPLPNDPNTENVFSKVYSLTLREEQIRSSIIDMNEKMNYLNKLIIDSQMALQGCCKEHKRLLEEENNIREQRLQILQEAMNNKNSNVDSTNTGAAPQPMHISQQVQPVTVNHQTEPTFCQTSSGQQVSFIPAPQPTLGSKAPNSARNPAFNSDNDSSAVLTKKDCEKRQSWPCTPLSEASSTFQPLTQSHVHPDPLHSEGTSSIQPVHKNASGKQDQINMASKLNPVDSISLGSDTAASTTKAVSKKITDKTLGLNISSQESALGFQPVTIKQELPSLSTPLPEKASTVSESLSPSNATSKSHGPSTGRVLEEKRLPQEKHANNITDRLSEGTGKQKLTPTRPDLMSFDEVEIKKEPITPPPEAGEKNKFFSLESADNKKGPVFTDPVKERETQKEGTGLSDNPRNTQEMSPKGNPADAEMPPSTQDKSPGAQPVINFESIQIKKEPVSPSPDTEMKNEDTFFIPQMLLTDRNDKHSDHLKQRPGVSETEKTAVKNLFPSSVSNLLGSKVRKENAQTSSSMSTTYLGSMPNDFLDQLTLSWKKRKAVAATSEVSSSIPEHSLSDSESVSDRNASSSFIQKSTPGFYVPSRMNPRVCLEPLNLKFHRKRTLSEPGSTSDSNPVSAAGGEEPQELQLDPKMRFFVKPSEKGQLKCAGSTDLVAESDGPKVKRKNLRSGAWQKANSLKTLSDPPGDVKSSAMDPMSDLLNDKDSDTNSDNFKECKPSAVPEDSPMTNDSDIKSEFSVSTLNDLNSENPNSSSTAPSDTNPDSNFPANPMNILNNLNMLHVVRTKKFPRTHLNGSQLPTFKGGAKNPANGLHIFEDHLYVSYQGSSPCKFSIDTGECSRVYNCTPYNVQCMLVSRINKNKAYLFSGGASELLLVFDEATGIVCSHIGTCKKIYSLHERWGSLFVGLSEGGVTKVNLKSLRKISELSYGSKPINCLATCTEGAQKLLCVGAYDASILIVDAMTGLLLKTLNCYQRLLYSIKVHQNLIFSCSSDKTLQVHDITSGKLLRCLQDHSSTISCLHVEDNLLVTGSHDKRINVYSSCNPREPPVIFFTASKEPVSCLAVHNHLIYCGNFFGQIETIQFDTTQKWVCKYNSCELVFGQRKGLFYHLVNQHLQMTGLNWIQCLWENCNRYIYSVLDITEHCENHLDQISQPV